jgi:S1-C subfamily serine protease
MRSLILSLALLATCVASAAAQSVVPDLQAISVTIRAGGSQGSGVLFTRGERTFVWTAAHVVDGLRHTRTVIVEGTPKLIVEFEDAKIVQEFKEDGRRIGESVMDCRIVRYSDSEQGEDLALLEVRKHNFTTASARFYSGSIPEIGTELYHVGSLLGQFGANSLTAGNVSQIGRVLDLKPGGTIFDQTTVTAFPGSSGGGVFLKSNGEYVGMLVRGAGEGFNFIVPIRRMRAWAQSAKVEWAIDSSVPVPSEAELKKLPIEDSGVQFDAHPSADSMRFRTLLNRDEFIPSPNAID